MLFEVGERADGALQHLVRHRLHVVAGDHGAVQRRLANRQVLREAQLEFAQARASQRAAKPGDRRRTDSGAARQRIDVGEQHGLWVFEHGRGDLTVGGRQRRGTLAHGHEQVAGGGARGLAWLGHGIGFRRGQKKVRIAPVTRYSSSTVKSTRHLSKVVHGCEMPVPTRSPTCRSAPSGTASTRADRSSLLYARHRARDAAACRGRHENATGPAADRCRTMHRACPSSGSRVRVRAATAPAPIPRVPAASQAATAIARRCAISRCRASARRNRNHASRSSRYAISSARVSTGASAIRERRCQTPPTLRLTG